MKDERETESGAARKCGKEKTYRNCIGNSQHIIPCGYSLSRVFLVPFWEDWLSPGFTTALLHVSPQYDVHNIYRVTRRAGNKAAKFMSRAKVQFGRKTSQMAIRLRHLHAEILCQMVRRDPTDERQGLECDERFIQDRLLVCGEADAMYVRGNAQDGIYLSVVSKAR